jgi:hypothetical protein
MEKLLLKFIRFIKNPLSGFFFYLICASIFLYIPPEGFGTVVFVFTLPFVLFVVIGLNLPFFSTLFRRFTMSKDKKQNHALEHGTIYFLKKKFGNSLRVGGHAEKNGFRICGVSKKHDITNAFDRFIKESSGENQELFVSLRCGSNIATSQAFGIILITISAFVLRIFETSNPIMASVLVGNVIFYFLLRKDLGNWVQEKLFMSTDFSGARIHSINKVKKRKYLEINPVYFVKTIIE